MKRWVLGILVSILVICSTVLTAQSVTYYLATDVPADLGGVTFTTNQLVRNTNASYVLEASLPAGKEVAALHRIPNGNWLFSPAVPTSLDTIEYLPRDVVGYDGVTFSLLLDGNAAGIPDGARIDSLFLHSTGAFVLSFDVPVDLGGTEYSRSDLVRHEGGPAFSLFWDAEATGVPPYANVVGADVDSSGNPVLSFDVPTELGGVDYMPGELVLWDGAAFSSFFIDASWPQSAQLRDFSFVPSAPSGAVPDGSAIPGSPLMVSHAAGGDITLSWDASCVGGDSDFEIYEGIIGTPNSHTQTLCSTGGATTQTLTPSASATYYFVVPRNQIKEGSYGLTSSLTERPQGVTVCLPREIGVCQ